MFVKLSRIVTMMKKAYKEGGLRVASSERFYALEGRGWAMQIYQGFTPKELLGEIVKLTGELPDDGEQFLAKEEGNQQEILYRKGDYLDVYRNALEAEAGGKYLDQTQFMVTTQGGHIYIVLQGKDNDMSIMPAEMATMIDMKCLAENESLGMPFRGLGNSYYRSSNHMAMAISLYTPEKLIPAVKFLSGNDLIGIMEAANAQVP